MRKSILLFVLSVSLMNFCNAQSDTAKHAIPGVEEFDMVYEKMMESIKYVKTAKFKMVKNERIDGEIIESEQYCKMQVNPRKVYMHILKGPKEGSEILFVQGENDGDLLVNISPYLPNLSIDPFGFIAKENQRHTIFQLGFEYTGQLIEHNYKKFKKVAATPENFQYGGIIKFNGRDVYKISLNHVRYAIVGYTVLEQEDLIKIARKLNLDEYGILELNPWLEDYFDVKAGQRINIPNSFSKSVTMYIDAETFLPVYQKISDLKGLIGEYSYSDIEINPRMKIDEFTEDFAEYGF